MGEFHLTSAFGVYKIRNKVNDNIYIGSTIRSFSVRWRQWRGDLNRGRGNKHLLSAWCHYGAEAFEFSVVEAVADPSEVFAREQYWIDYLDPEYNFDKIVTPVSPETRRKMRESSQGQGLGRKMSDETKAKIAASAMGNTRNLGKKRSEETKAKLREANKGQIPWTKGKKMSDEARANMSKAQKGHAVSAEQRAAISAKLKGHKYNVGRKLSPEHCAKLAEAKRGNKNMLGHKHSEESKAKMRAGHLGIKPSAETLAKLSAIRKSKKPRLGHKASEETRRKMSESRKAFLAQKQREPQESS